MNVLQGDLLTKNSELQCCFRKAHKNINFLIFFSITKKKPKHFLWLRLNMSNISMVLKINVESHSLKASNLLSCRWFKVFNTRESGIFNTSNRFFFLNNEMRLWILKKNATIKFSSKQGWYKSDMAFWLNSVFFFIELSNELTPNHIN